MTESPADSASGLLDGDTEPGFRAAWRADACGAHRRVSTAGLRASVSRVCPAADWPAGPYFPLFAGRELWAGGLRPTGGPQSVVPGAGPGDIIDVRGVMNGARGGRAVRKTAARAEPLSPPFPGSALTGSDLALGEARRTVLIYGEQPWRVGLAGEGACQKAGKFSVSSIKDNGTQKLQLRGRTVLVWSCGVVETPGCHLTSWPHRRIRRGSIPIKAQRCPDRACESTQVYSQHRCQAAWL
ncbi:hypothetical protein SKAU_G00178570 [Synaphobranchus kaupii]|uniref:Uncharacterized protein n=1 Tax=Synaphobranchus kaupii TaxID=118154 RepID=A0A9Q1FMB9_SYNKA|nr:hypothetical protein SKAU_G00178570 [Synaphobranchus kaupii]